MVESGSCFSVSVSNFVRAAGLLVDEEGEEMVPDLSMGTVDLTSSHGPRTPA